MKIIPNSIFVVNLLTGINLVLPCMSGFAQSSGGRLMPAPAVWFLTRAPDARAGGMGDAGVAASPDANATYWNASKLAFADRDFGASVSYRPWLRSLTNDLWMGYASAYKKIGKGQALALSANYFNRDVILFPYASPGGAAYASATQMSLGAAYAAQVGKNFSVGVTLKYISSNPQGGMILNGVSIKPGRAFAGDVSAYYRKHVNNKVALSFGGVISDFGGKINYGPASDAQFIPTTLKIGGGFSFNPNQRHQFNLIADLSKLMVPTPDTLGLYMRKSLIRGIFGSFGDAPGGFKEEMQEIVLSLGTEYWYKNTLALRGGFYGENKNKGGREYFTVGAGLRLFKNYQADFSRTIPVAQNSPLARMYKISVSAYLAAKK